MIKGFETETGVLTQDEQVIATEIAYILMNHVGQENIVKSDKIIEVINNSSKLKIAGPRFRKIINHLRTSGMVKNLLATSGGYYIETDLEKVQKYIDGLRHRGESILAVCKAMENQTKKRYNTPLFD